MNQINSTSVVDEPTLPDSQTDLKRKEPGGLAAPPPGGRGWFTQYKPEQGKSIRIGTFVGVSALVAWGVKFLYDRLEVYQWRLVLLGDYSSKINLIKA